jgi:hypothetical protein
MPPASEPVSHVDGVYNAHGAKHGQGHGERAGLYRTRGEEIAKGRYNGIACVNHEQGGGYLGANLNLELTSTMSSASPATERSSRPIRKPMRWVRG